MKIGIISTFPRTQCGIATYASDLLRGLKLQYPGLNIIQLEMCHQSKKRNNLNKCCIRSYQTEDYLLASEFINSSDIDVIDIQHEFKIFGKPDGKNVEILLDHIHKPIVTTLHTVNAELPSERIQTFYKILNKSTLLHVFSQESKNHLIERYKIKPQKISVIPHGVPVLDFRAPADIKRKKRFPDILTFISTGHMRDTKGYHIALEALGKLKDDLQDFHYFMVGSNHPENETAQSYRKRLLELVAILGIANNVTFIDQYLSLKELCLLIQAADICLLPYTRSVQSSSGVLALMIACGRPIVVTPFQFAISFMTEEFGITSKSFSSEDFAIAIKQLIENSNNLNKIMRHNHSIGQSWSWANVANQYFEGYQKALIEK